MSTASLAPLGPSSHDPWFRRKPRLAWGAVAALFLTLSGLRLLEWASADAYSMFYVLPVALAATSFGERGGVVTSLVAVLLIAVTTYVRGVTPDAVGWATRVVPVVLLGVLVGRATDRLREAEALRHRVEMAALLHRQAIEINDSLVQRISAAKWSLEAGRTEAALQALTVAVDEAQLLVSGLIRRAEMGELAEPVSDRPESPGSAGG